MSSLPELSTIDSFPSMLCNFCKDRCGDVIRLDLDLDVRNQRNSGGRTFLSAQTAQQLEEGINLGCHLCLMFLGKLPDTDRLAVQQRLRLNSGNSYVGHSWGRALAGIGTPAAPPVHRRLYISLNSQYPGPDGRMPSSSGLRDVGHGASFRILAARGTTVHR